MSREPEYLVERGSVYAWLTKRQYRTALRWACNPNRELPGRVPRRTARCPVANRLVIAAVLLRRRLTGKAWCRVVEYNDGPEIGKP